MALLNPRGRNLDEPRLGPQFVNVLCSAIPHARPQSADELDILHLCDYVMGVEAAEIVGKASAPPEEPTERDRGWFFKLFSLRGVSEGEERMCFFAFLQKADDTAW